MRRTSYRPARKTLRLKIERRIARSAVGLKGKGKRLYCQLSSRGGVSVGASINFESFASQREIGLEHWTSLHIIRETLETIGLKVGAAGDVGE
jgi:hypothetical protein